MVDPNRPVIPYARAAVRVNGEPRASRLAVAAVPAAILSSPCLILPALWFVPDRFCAVACFSGAAIGPTLSIAAIVRVRRSRGQLVGASLAGVALFLSVVQWGFIFWAMHHGGL